MTNAGELVIGVAEAADTLGVHPATVTRWALSGKLPYLRKMPGKTGAFLFNAETVRRKAQELTVRKAG